MCSDGGALQAFWVDHNKNEKRSFLATSQTETSETIKSKLRSYNHFFLM
jgi:hypothetical protein